MTLFSNIICLIAWQFQGPSPCRAPFETITLRLLPLRISVRLPVVLLLHPSQHPQQLPSAVVPDWTWANSSAIVHPKKNSCVIPNSLEDLGKFLYRNPPELCLLCAPDTSATLSAICTGTLWNLISILPQNPPEPCLLSAPEPSGSLSAICTGRLRNPPEPSPEPGVATAPDSTRAALG